MATQGALFNRVKVWLAGEVLDALDLNAEFDNILNNLMPTKFSGYSATVAQMQIQTNPGALGSEVLATSLAGEISAIRFVLSEITGNQYWYQVPSISLSQVNTLLQVGIGIAPNRVVSGRVDAFSQPQFLVAGGTALSFTLKAGGSNPDLDLVVNNSAVTVSSDIVVTGLNPAPVSGNTAIINDARIINDPYAGQDNAIINKITISSVGAAITAQIGNYCAFKVTDGILNEYFLGYVKDATTITHVLRGYYFDSGGNPIVRVPINNGDTITIMRLTWVFAANTGTALGVVYTNPVVSTDQPASPGTGDYWFDMIAHQWKIFNGTMFTVSNSTLIGTVIQDSIHCVGSRSGDFFAVYSALNTLGLTINGNLGAVSRSNRAQVSVAGSVLNYLPYAMQFNSPTNLDTGVTLANNTKYYFYISNTGKAFISDEQPYDRTQDLQGYYHPYKPWRCVGQTITDGSAHFVVVGDLSTDVVSCALAMIGTGGYTAPSGTTLVVPYDTAVYDPLQISSGLGTNTAGIRIPRDGLYHVSAFVAWSTTNFNTEVEINVNVIPIGGGPTFSFELLGQGNGIGINFAYPLNCGDFVTVFSNQQSAITAFFQFPGALSISSVPSGK